MKIPKQLFILLVILGFIHILFAALVDAKSSMLAPWFVILAITETALHHHEGYLHLYALILTMSFACICSLSKSALFAFYVWLTINYAGAVWFVLCYDGHS